MRINLILNWRAMLARAQVRIIGIKRDLFWIPFGVILPLLGVSTFIFIYKSLNVPEFAYGFVIIGGAMIAYWLNILCLSTLLGEDDRKSSPYFSSHLVL